MIIDKVRGDAFDTVAATQSFVQRVCHFPFPCLRSRHKITSASAHYVPFSMKAEIKVIVRMQSCGVMRGRGSLCAHGVEAGFVFAAEADLHGYALPRLAAGKHEAVIFKPGHESAVGH